MQLAECEQVCVFNRVAAVGVAGGSVYRCKEVASGKKHDSYRNEGALIRPFVRGK